MTFNQWCSGKRFDPHTRIALEAIWSALKHRGLIEPARCMKYRQITLQEGQKIPDDAASCKYFDENPAPPPRFAKP
jgi:hypothetical protein